MYHKWYKKKPRPSKINCKIISANSVAVLLNYTGYPFNSKELHLSLSLSRIHGLHFLRDGAYLLVQTLAISRLRKRVGFYSSLQDIQLQRISPVKSSRDSKLSFRNFLDFWKIMKLLFLLLLSVLILARSARSPSFDVRLHRHGSSSIPIASFVERELQIIL